MEKCLVATFHNPDFISTLKFSLKYLPFLEKFSLGAKVKNCDFLRLAEATNIMASEWKINDGLRRSMKEKKWVWEATIVLKRFHINFKRDWIFIRSETKKKRSTFSILDFTFVAMRDAKKITSHASISLSNWKFLGLFLLFSSSPPSPSSYGDCSLIIGMRKMEIDSSNLIWWNLFDVSLVAVWNFFFTHECLKAFY